MGAGLGGVVCAEGQSDFYTEPQLYESRPAPTSEVHFGDFGVTGLKLRIFPGVLLKVVGTTPGTPADGKFNKGETVTGVNGVVLKGHNPFVAMGNALTEAEAKDGKLVLDVLSADGNDARQETVTIPVLGAYSSTWPLRCGKSQAIVKAAADFYAKSKDGGIEGALACLFLLSTGDDQYLPIVKAYFEPMAKNVKGIGDSTWSNGYNGIACAEYYLRTGDASVLPVLQYFCDDARDRQKYGIGWSHWGKGVDPGYVAGGLLNAAGAQLVTTLLLGKECGVEVDEKTLLGALTMFYRFAGHGSVAYGDHRPEGWPGSADGKDGMVAAMMQIACGSSGNVDIYRKARDYYCRAMVGSASVLVRGHGDDGRGDAIWRGLTSARVLDLEPAEYHAAMNSLRWWYDLSRRPSGGFGVATISFDFDTEGSGAGVALGYTAPLKTLRITGAPRSNFAKDFTLPEHLWGRKADVEFLSIKDAKPGASGEGKEPPAVTWLKLWPSATNMPRAELLRNVYHWNYTYRTNATKALLQSGSFKDLEELLEHEDPRIRRAALDGLTDYQYWHWVAIGGKPIKSQDMTPAMLASIRAMLADPDEALFVVDGALMAMSLAPVSEIEASLPLILPWTTHEEWWLRAGAFNALLPLARDAASAAEVLPVLSDMMLRETRAQPREGMTGALARLAGNLQPDSEERRQVTTIFQRAAETAGNDADLGADVTGFYFKDSLRACLQFDAASSLDVARLVKDRFAVLKTEVITSVVESLLAGREKLPATAREELTGMLYGDYRQELIRRMKGGENLRSQILTLTNLEHPELGWREIGTPGASSRVWRFTSFEPQGKDVLSPYEGTRFRDVTLPAGLEKWYLPEFDAGTWTSGKAPIGKGVYRQDKTFFENRSAWGEGEFLLMRTTFELESLNHDYYRVVVLANQGFRVYLNGTPIHQYVWWNTKPQYAPQELDANALQALRKGTNVLAVYANAAYQDDVQVGQCDVRLEGLTKADLFGEEEKK